MNYIQNALIIGAGGHSRVVISILRELNVCQIEGILDLSEIESSELILGVPVLGSVALLDKLNSSKKLDYYLAIGDNLIRRYWYEKLSRQNCSLPNLISPHAIVDASAILGDANMICSRAFIGPGAVIQSNNLFNTGSIIEHEVIVGSHCHFAPASSMAGRVVVGDECFIGAGATILPKVRIVDRVMVGGGALINRDLQISGSTYVGVPGKLLEKGG
jgi:UDP-perosamine 4-acetyltransferase